MSTKQVWVQGEMMVHFDATVWVDVAGDAETEEICAAAILEAEKYIDIKVTDGRLLGQGPDGIVEIRIPDEEPDWYDAEPCG